MSATLTGIRPSLWARCPTAAIFQGRGEIEADQPPEVQEWFFRGNVFEEIVVRQIAAKHGKENVQRQVVIPVDGIGEGHADAYLIPERTLIEVKSTVAAHPNSDIFEHGVRQARIYTHFHPEAEQAALYMLNPNRMTPADIYPVKLTDADREQIEAERSYIVEGVGGGELHLDEHGTPNRPCTKPGQARGRMCPFASACFGDDWREDVTEVDSPDVLAAVSALDAIKQVEAEHRKALAGLEQERKDVQGRLSEMLPVGNSLVGPFSVKRIHKSRRPSFSEKAAKAAGFPVEVLAEFYYGGSEWDEFRIGRADVAGDVDFGEEAPF